MEAIQCVSKMDFNSRSRAGSDLQRCHEIVCIRYFNSRSRAGSDPIPSPDKVTLFNFNSRSRAGSDLPVICHVACAVCISIHAPVRGATVTVPVIKAIGEFQFTLPCGERLGKLAQCNWIHHFNSRSRAGSDNAAGAITGVLSDFNSRSRAGSDCHFFGSVCRLNISIHAPVRGATHLL